MKSEECISILYKVSEKLEEALKAGCRIPSSSFNVLEGLIDTISQIYLLSVESPNTASRLLAKYVEDLEGIDNIIVDPAIYSELISKLLMGRPRSMKSKKNVIRIKKLMLSVIKSDQNKVTVYSSSKYSRSYPEDVDKSWKNLYVLGDEIIIKGRKLPLLTFINYLHIGYPTIIPIVNIDNVALRGLILYRGDSLYSPGLFNMNASLPLAFINMDILSKGDITINVEPMERGAMIELVNSIVKGYALPEKYRGDHVSEPLYLTMSKQIMHILNNPFIEPRRSRGSPEKEVREYLNFLLRNSREKVGLIILRVQGMTRNKLVVPRDSELNLYWICLDNQEIKINDKSMTCSNESRISLTTSKSNKSVIIGLDSTNNLFSIAKKKPVLEIEQK